MNRTQKYISMWISLLLIAVLVVSNIFALTADAGDGLSGEGWSGEADEPEITPDFAPSPPVLFSLPADITNLQTQIDGATDGETIEFESGTFWLPGTININNKTLNFVSKGTTILNISNGRHFTTAGNVTLNMQGMVLDGQLLNDSVGGIEVTDSGTVTISGGTIRNSKYTNGGGVLIADGASVSIVGCNIENCRSVTSGGAVYGNANVNLTLQGSNFYYSEAGGNGGAVSISSGVLNVSSCNFIGNWAALSGGGIYTGAPLTMTDTQFVSNQALSGGGLHLNSVNGGITGGQFVSNEAKVQSSIGGWGGGVSINSGAVLTASGVSFASNTAVNGGGGVYSDGGILSFTNGSFTSNTTTGDGGAVHIDNLNNLTMTGVALATNTAPLGYSWDLLSPLNPAEISAAAVHGTNITGTSYTSPFTNAYSNCDVNFTGGSGVPVSIVLLEIRYYQDQVDSVGLLGSVSTTVFSGDTIANTAAGAFGSNWLNQYQPGGYAGGIVMENIQQVLSANTVLHVLYTGKTSVRVEYYKDSPEAGNLITAVVINDLVISDSLSQAIAQVIGNDWLNLHRPENYGYGRLVEPLPDVLGSDIVLRVLYQRGNSRNAGPEPYTYSTYVKDKVKEDGDTDNLVLSTAGSSPQTGLSGVPNPGTGFVPLDIILRMAAILALLAYVVITWISLKKTR